MNERDAQQLVDAREQIRQAVGFSVADEIAKLDQLRASGSISDEEFKKLRAKLI
ncbi:SHOCT domain-containing protein [Paracoccus aestuariivivens]|nr:SHOCT domain-containing protein [Paracoccus aestuariivivens]